MAPEPKILDPRAIDALRRRADQVIRLLQGGTPRDGGDAAAAAKEKTPVRGQFHSQASILFTDFVGFTRHTEALEPAVLLETLARYFGAFDKICERFDLTRIKTIGDSYMAAAGIPSASGEQRPRRLGGGGLGSPHRPKFRPSHRRQSGRTWHRHLGRHRQCCFPLGIRERRRSRQYFRGNLDPARERHDPRARHPAGEEQGAPADVFRRSAELTPRGSCSGERLFQGQRETDAG
jgi:class 3 adenylate cyclase